MEKKEKEAFFEELHRLDDEFEEVENLSNADVILRYGKMEPKATANRNRISTLNYSPSMAPKAPEDDNLLHIHQPSKAESGAKASSTSKRKRDQSFKLIAESQQLFKGLRFFFFPNNDTSPVRSFRIRKAIEYGAIWFREWQSTVTHVIVDNCLCYKDLIGYLKVDALPREVVLVNETYLSDCITFRYLIDASLLQYRIAGHEEALAPKLPSTPALSTATSLKLNPDKGEGLELKRTPPRTDSSDASQSYRSAAHRIKASGRKAGSARQSQHLDKPLNRAIEEVKANKDVPLDLDDENASKGGANVDDIDEDYSEDEKKTRKKTKHSYNISWQESLSCMSKHDGKGQSPNPNARTIEVLQQMANYYDRGHDHLKLIAYRRAIPALRNQSTKIMTMDEAFAIPCIGERLAKKIEEIVCTDKLKRLDNAHLEPDDKVLQIFLKIYGVGHARAAKWINQGHRTIDDLLGKVQLTKNQKIGIEHLDDFQTRIPRTEMDRHVKFVRETCSKIDASIQFIIAGSYRRGADESGDVDFVVTRPNCPMNTLRTIMLETVIPGLFNEGYLKVGLATTAKDHGSKWQGAAALPETTVWRRIDFLFVPDEELGAALMYFTGNDIFNRRLRLLASEKGMRLNQHGLYKDVIRGKKRERITQGTLVEGRDEKKIFELLGVPWRPPEHRMC